MLLLVARGAHAVRGGAKRVLWVEQFWNVHPRKLDREIFADCPSAKIGSLENFQLYGTNYNLNPTVLSIKFLACVHDCTDLQLAADLFAACCISGMHIIIYGKQFRKACK